MSEPDLCLSKLKETLSNYEPIDAVVLEMLPPRTAALAGNCHIIIEALVKSVESLTKTAANLQHGKLEMSEALRMYGEQTGDPMFMKNLELCLKQVRGNPK